MAAETSKRRTKGAALPGKGKPKAKPSGEGSKKRTKRGALPGRGKPKAKLSGGGSRKSSSKRTTPVKSKTFAEDPGEPLSWEEIKAATGLTDEDIAELPELMKRALSPVQIVGPPDPCAEAEWLESLAQELEKSLDEGPDKKATGSTAVEKPPPDVYCRVITREGKQPLTKAQYDELVKRRCEYDMFIDGMTRETSCRMADGELRSARLGPKEQAMLFEVIEAGKPIQPHETETWGRRTGWASACHLFRSARRKADLGLGRYESRAFRLHRNPTDRDSSSYEFAPPDDLKFCFIIPA